MKDLHPVLNVWCCVGFFLCFFHSSSASSSSPTVRGSPAHTCNSKDRDALVGFSASLDFGVPGWPPPGNGSFNCCRWPGVRCDVPSSSRKSSVSESRVVGLELAAKRLRGAVAGKPLLGLDGLRRLNLSHNSLTGVIPAELFRLRQLEVLDISNNLLSGELSDRIGNISSLRHLDISSNNFSGSIPNSFHGLRKLQRLSARSNAFTGGLPVSLASCSMLNSLDLGNNSLAGEIGIDFTSLVHLHFLRLDSNRFVGLIPENLSSCTGLKLLNLGNNSLHGQIPSGFKNLQALFSLSLWSNGLTNVSEALAILSECRNLSVLVLGTNFRGELIPRYGITGFQSLKFLQVANCSLRGPVPSWLMTCAQLKLLDLSSNNLDGDVPPWLGNFTHLLYLDLSNNSFRGGLPTTWANLKCLTSTNCSFFDNSLFELPFYLRWKTGQGQRYVFSSLIPPMLALGHNLLNGPIVKEFGNLKWLHFLDLSNNYFSGSIPEELSNMSSLESLDLSHNNLSGSLPSSLTKMGFLSQFNVAYNNLSGEVPQGGQFMTFSSASFEGNPGLCHGPLFWGCFPVPPAGGTPMPPANGNETEMEDFKITFMPLPYGIGVVIGFIPTAVICGFYSRYRRRKKKERRD